MSVEVRRALYGKMAGDSTLTNMLGTAATGFTQSIYYQEAPESAGFPYVVFSKSVGTPVYTMSNGGSAFDVDVWDIKGVDRNSTADKVDAISARLDALLTDGALTISGAELMYLRRESDFDYSEVVKGVAYKHAGHGFRLFYQ